MSIQVWAWNWTTNFPPLFQGNTSHQGFFDLPIKAMKTPKVGFIFFPLSHKCCRTPHEREKIKWFCPQMASFALRKLFPSPAANICVFLGKSEFIPYFHPPFSLVKSEYLEDKYFNSFKFSFTALVIDRLILNLKLQS